MRAIDLYGGIGGWALGLRMAGIETLCSFDYSGCANETLRNNFAIKTHNVNIRELDYDLLPKRVDVVVGSPPCTQFSFANRGGKGDLEDGLVDIRKFLKVVEYLKPKYWAMENVPRVAKIIEHELKDGRSLSKYVGLFRNIVVVDCSEYGLPQKRKRMIAGSLPFSLFEEYKGILPQLTLGNVISSLKARRIKDCVYPKITIDRKLLTDNDYEMPLTEEEIRINREAKTYHTIYNKMSFPDKLNEPSRTVTALCTRISRESIVIKNGTNKYRRLSIREREMLQGFPVTFQLYGSYIERIKMAGNAIPPLLTYLLGCSMMGVKVNKVGLDKHCKYNHRIPKQLPDKQKIVYKPNKFSINRNFRFALPNLRFGSGVRFEMVNTFANDSVNWRIDFYFGNSKNILNLKLDNILYQKAVSVLSKKTSFKLVFKKMREIKSVSASELQSVWNHSSEEGKHPFNLLDELGTLAQQIYDTLITNAKIVSRIQHFVANELMDNLNSKTYTLSSASKMKYIDNAVWIYTGLIIGSLFNQAFST
jgi:DNA (cytosine-5)-methyltransferase 1